MIPEAAQRAAENAYCETLTELRLAEGGGFKVASQNRRALHAALEAAAPHMLAGVSTLDELVMLEPGIVIQGPDFHEETFKCTAPGTFHAIASPTEYRPSELVGRGPFTIIYRPTP